MRTRVTLLAVLVLLAASASAAPLPGTASLTGAVQAPKPFQGAQVQMLNVDRNILFMVYTSGGRYQAVHLLPGRYEVTVRTTGLAGDPQTIVLEAGAARTLDFALREQAAEPVRQGEFGFTTRAASEVKLVSYDELYPREPGREVLEKQCMYCHGKNFFPNKQYPEVTWNAFIDVMVNGGRDRRAMVPAGTLGAQDRATLLAYLTKQYGPASVRRGLRMDAEFPVDEAALGKAMYVEYYLPLDKQIDAGNKQRRTPAAALRSRRQRLVHRPQRAEPHRPRRSAHRRVQGLDDAGSEGGPPRPDRRRGWARLVGGDPRLLTSAGSIPGPARWSAIPWTRPASRRGAATARSWTASRTCGSP